MDHTLHKLALFRIFESMLLHYVSSMVEKTFSKADKELQKEILAAIYPRPKSFENYLPEDDILKFSLLKAGRFGHSAPDITICLDIVNSRLKVPNDRILAKIYVSAVEVNDTSSEHIIELGKIKFIPEKSQKSIDTIIEANRQIFSIITVGLLQDPYLLSKADETFASLYQQAIFDLVESSDFNKLRERGISSKRKPTVEETMSSLSKLDNEIEVTDDISSLLKKYSLKNDKDDFEA